MDAKSVGIYRRNGIFYVNFMENGHRKQLSLHTGMRSEIPAALERLFATRDAANKDCITWALDWIDDRFAMGVIEESTALYYHRDIMAWKPWLSMPLTTVSRKDVERGIRSMLKQGRVASTVRRRCIVMGKAMRAAVTCGDAPSNPFSGVELPKIRRIEHNCLPPDERERVRAYITSSCTRLSVAVALGLWCGMRCQEICGLKVSDIDFERRICWVRRAIGTKANGYYLKKPKNGRVRDVPMPEPLIDVIDRWMASPERDGGEWLIGRNGEWCKTRWVSRAWSVKAQALQLRGILGKKPTFHDLRHTYATVAIASGIDVKTVSSVLGHSSAAMTLDVYAVADPQAKRMSAQIMAHAI